MSSPQESQPIHPIKFAEDKIGYVLGILGIIMSFPMLAVPFLREITIKNFHAADTSMAPGH